ncbi:MAG: hypothetical protein RLZZ385_2172 [Pseudomonadota bacterium]
MEEAKTPVPTPPPGAANDAKRVVVPLPIKAGNQPPAARTADRDSPAALFYALVFPQLAALSEARRQHCLTGLAALGDRVSAAVSFHPQALVLEIRSSLKYFGGLQAIHEQLKPLLQAQLKAWGLPDEVQHAAAPTVTGSLLLARARSGLLVHRRDNLRSALGRLPVSVLQLDQEPARRLHNMGVRHLQDIWRLPTDGLRKRFGSDFVNLLNRALGKAPDPTRNYQPPPAFATAYDLPHEVEDLTRLLPVADELVAQLCDFLRRRDLSTSQLVFSLRHERQDNTEVDISLRRASRDRRHLLLLLETRLTRLELPAPVVGVALAVRQFDAFTGCSEALHGHAATPRSHALGQFLEHLQARLGDSGIKGIHCVAEHCPEYAGLEANHDDPLAILSPPRNRTHEAAPVNPRPLWLLPQPRPLTIRDGRLYHQRALCILSGPERIETRWWSGTDIRRDYYVAEETGGSLLWIYREKTGEQRWFLHGLFA